MYSEYYSATAAVVVARFPDLLKLISLSWIEILSIIDHGEIVPGGTGLLSHILTCGPIQASALYSAVLAGIS